MAGPSKPWDNGKTEPKFRHDLRVAWQGACADSQGGIFDEEVSEVKGDVKKVPEGVEGTK